MDARATAVDIRDHVSAGRARAIEVCDLFLSRAAAIDPALSAFLTVDADFARRQAAEVDRRVAGGKRFPLAGVPIGVKDTLCTRGLTTTAASRILEGYVPPYDATAVARLRAAGAVVLGKTNCDEFAMGSSTENSAFGPTRNPWAADRTPGGSSGGSAAAVAARLAPAALGSDTGGSIRQPAAFCGTVGLRPTWGRVSRYGLIAFASSLDQVGPLARTARDAAALLSAIAGPDEADATASAAPGADFEAALAVLADQGASLVEVELPHERHAIPVYYLIATAEASANLARYDGVRFGLRVARGPGGGVDRMYRDTRGAGFGPEVVRRIMLGTYALSAGYYEAYYQKAQAVRMLIRRDYDEAFARVDVVATPTAPTAAFGLGEKMHDPMAMYLADILTVGPSLAGLPAISVPCGFSRASLPIGLQLIGRPFDEATLFAAAGAYERATRWHAAEPPAAGLPPLAT